jgi:hypothetical protein
VRTAEPSHFRSGLSRRSRDSPGRSGGVGPDARGRPPNSPTGPRQMRSRNSRGREGGGKPHLGGSRPVLDRDDDPQSLPCRQSARTRWNRGREAVRWARGPGGPASGAGRVCPGVPIRMPGARGRQAAEAPRSTAIIVLRKPFTGRTLALSKFLSPLSQFVLPRQSRTVGAPVNRFVASGSLRSWRAAVAVVFASLILMPRASDAACGDYVHVSGQSMTSFRSMSDHASTADPLAADVTGDRTPHPPCHGPGCSNGSLPSPAPVPTVVVSMERGALAPADRPSVVICRSNMLAEPADLIVDGFRSSILRPPR